MAQRTSRRRIVLWIVTALVLLFIFVQSVLPEAISADESGWVRTHILSPLFGWLGMRSPSQNLVRKLAHIFEFAVLSAFLLFCFRGNLLRSLIIGFSAAFLDESIQLLSGRGAQIRDVWIDLIGVAAGALLGFLLYKAIDRSRKNKQNQQQ